MKSVDTNHSNVLTSHVIGSKQCRHNPGIRLVHGMIGLFYKWRTASRTLIIFIFFFFSSRRRHTRYWRDWSSDVCSSDLVGKICPTRQTFPANVARFSEREGRPQSAMVVLTHSSGNASRRLAIRQRLIEIGRASCRERV